MNILLIDDDIEQTTMLAEYLSGEGFTAQAVYNAADGTQAALSGSADLVILDIMMPGGNGIDALRAIRARSDVPVIMLTARGNDTERVVGLELGADDYVTKPYYPRELVARLRAVMRRPARAAEQSNGSLLAGELTLDRGRRHVAWRNVAIDLTATEFNLLEALMRAGDCVATKDELSLRLLGRRRESYDRSIDVHISNLRQKLEPRTGGPLRIETVRGVGWRLVVS
ncbi:MAG TPA: response regulator transcription factor [Sphingobium sp.]